MSYAAANKPLILSVTLAYFAMATILTISTYYLMNKAMVEQIVASGETNNILLAQGFAQSLWPRFGQYVSSVQNTDPPTLKQNPETKQLRVLTRQLAQNLPVLKLKVYNLDGITVYSSQETQIGENKAGNPGFEAAKRGRPASKMSQRGSFSGFYDVVSNVALTETYVPVRNERGDLEGVFELYTNVSAAFKASQMNLYMFMLLMIGVLSIGYIILMALVMRFLSHAKQCWISTERHWHRQNQNLQNELFSIREQLESKLQELQMIRRYMADRP